MLRWLGASLALLVAFAGAFAYLENRAAYEESLGAKGSQPPPVRPLGSEDHIIGSLDAPVQLIAYSDFECPFCKTLFEKDIPRLRAQFPGRLVVAYRHRVLDSDPASKIGEEASECVAKAGGNDAFWRFADLMFAQPPGVDRKDPGVLASLAERAGASPSKYSACVKDGKGAAPVERDDVEAAVAGMTQSPSVVLISGRRNLVVYGEYYSQLFTGIGYLLEADNSR